MNEIIRHETGDPDEIARILLEQQAGAAAETVVIGEGKDRLVIAGPPRRGGCGDCTFCCTAAGINELQKPPLRPCRHLVASGQHRGCAIYADRPKTCEIFQCGWLMGNFDERFRPDRIGAYVAFFVTVEQGFYAVVQIASRQAHHKRVKQLVGHLIARLPQVRVIIDDDHGMLYRWGEPSRKFRMMPRAAGDFENANYLFDD